MNNNTLNPIPEELHVYSHNEGTVNYTTIHYSLFTLK